MRAFTIGYGGRDPQQLLEMLKAKGIKTIVDVRLKPERAYLGTYAKASAPEKGIEAFFLRGGIQYIWLPELGNVFLDCEDWRRRYQQLMDKAGSLLTERLTEVPTPFCLMCAEKHVSECHRSIIATWLAGADWEIEHIE